MEMVFFNRIGRDQPFAITRRRQAQFTSRRQCGRVRTNRARTREAKRDEIAVLPLRDFSNLPARLLRDFSREEYGLIGTKTRAPGIRH